MKLEAIVATDLLQLRAVAARTAIDAIAESARPLPDHIVDPVEICKELVRRVLLYCPQAGSAGISIFADETADTLTWSLVEGQCAPMEGGRFPLRHSMCGVCFETRALQLFQRPHRYFRWMHIMGVQIEEALVCPIFGIKNEVYGTFWAFSHDPAAPPFTSSDARVLTQLAALTRQAVSLLYKSAPAPSFEQAAGANRVSTERRKLGERHER